MSERWGGFSNEDKAKIRKQSAGRCDLSGDRNNNIVHHITGCYVGRLSGMPEELVSDASLNASMLSDEMAEMHDKEEDYQRACLEYEIKGHTIYEGKKYSTTKERNTHIHRRHKVFPKSSGRGRKSVFYWERTTQSRRANALGKRKKHR